MIEKFLVISYFDSRIGPNILYSKSDISNIYEFPDLSRILDFSNKDNTFLFSFRKFQTINTVFNMDSKIARGGTELIMISCIIRVSYFKNELTDIFKYLDSKKVFLEKFVYELKELPNFNLVLHKYHKNPSIEQFKEYCIEAHVDFFSIYDRYYDLIFPESEVKIITQDINLKKKILLIGPKGSGKDTFLRSIEVLQFHSQRNLDIPTRILSVIIDNIVIVNTSDFLEGKIGLESAQAIIFMIKNTDEDTTKEVNLLIENFISSYSSQLFGNIPLIIINNVFKGKKPLRAKEIKQYFKLDIVKKKKKSV